MTPRSEVDSPANSIAPRTVNDCTVPVPVATARLTFFFAIPDPVNPAFPESLPNEPGSPVPPSPSPLSPPPPLHDGVVGSGYPVCQTTSEPFSVSTSQ